MREGLQGATNRWELVQVVQDEYPEFVPFLRVVMSELGFSTTEVQEDIANFLVYGPMYLMIQAQRGQAKTTVTAAFAVWCLIHNPAFRVLIISAGGKQANEISTLIVRIFMAMDELECFRPDRNAGDKTSTEAFDLHHSLKGIEKSPSVRCEGVEASLQGGRADLLIADDIESGKNSKTEHLREQLLHITRDFTSICGSGRIVYLGTPQSMHSVYNTLPGRGYTIRIWPGRYPTKAQMTNYGKMLAPYVLENILLHPELQSGGGVDGKQGQPLDSQLPSGTEEFLQYKEFDQGQSYFQLQHMLNTKLADMERYPLRTNKILAVNVSGLEFPFLIRPSLVPGDIRRYNSVGLSYDFAQPVIDQAGGFGKLQGICMAVDPAGGGKNGDETGYAVVGFLNSTVWVLEVGGVPGGYSQTSYDLLADVAMKWQVNRIFVEKNFGHGAFLNAWLPTLRTRYKRVDKPEAQGGCAIEEVFETGQKELRIIDVLEPVIGRGSLVFNADIMDMDDASVQKYALAQRGSYSLLQQISTITRDRGSLGHDDRLDALATAVRYWVNLLGLEQTKILAKRKADEIKKWQANPLGHPGANKVLGKSRTHANMFDKRR